MLVKTKHFGEIELAEDKVLTFENGILGFENQKHYTILYNNENETRSSISWLQSLEEPTLALPIIHPDLVKEDYNPIVNEDALQSLGNLNEENQVVFVTLTVPSDLTKMTVNLKAPLVINAPKSVSIYRKEIYLQIQQSNKEAVEESTSVDIIQKLL